MKNTKTNPKITYYTITAIYFKNNFVNVWDGNRYVHQEHNGHNAFSVGSTTHDKRQL